MAALYPKKTAPFNATDAKLRDTKQVWHKLDELSGRNVNVREPITIVDADQSIHDDPQTVAELFNNFYQEKVKKIIDSLPAAAEPPLDKAPQHLNFKFKLRT